MKKLIFAIGLMLATLFAQAQNVCGSWRGVMTLGDREISVVFNVKKSGEVYTSTMDSPSQNVKGLTTSSTTFADSILTINMDETKMQYQGRLMRNNVMNGVFTQMNQRYALSMVNTDFNRNSISEKKSIKRNFTVYSYFTDTVLINKSGSVNTKAILYQPIKNKKSAAVVLVCDFDKDLNSKHAKELTELSDYLCSNGFVVICLGTSVNESSTEIALNYLKTCPEVNAKKVSFVKFDESCLIGTFISQKTSTQLYKEISKANVEKYEAYNQLTRWLLKSA